MAMPPAFDIQPLGRVVFEPGALNRLGELTRSLGGARALLVTDPGLESAGHPQRAAESLRRGGYAVTVFDRVKENPTEAEVADGVSVAKAANIDIRSYIPGDLPAVPLHKEMFRQALLNLLLNAEQAMPDGGQITLQAIVEPGPSVCLSLIDTGKGIPPETLDKIFEPFFSTKSTGSGLGLPTTKRIIEAHGGEISVQSEVGKGTKFTVRLSV